jgi:hypothetical protein
MHGGIYSTVGIGPGRDHIQVLPNLGGSILGIAMVLSRFESRFPPTGTPLDISWIRLSRG